MRNIFQSTALIIGAALLSAVMSPLGVAQDRQQGEEEWFELLLLIREAERNAVQKESRDQLQAGRKILEETDKKRGGGEKFQPGDSDLRAVRHILRAIIDNPSGESDNWGNQVAEALRLLETWPCCGGQKQKQDGTDTMTKDSSGVQPGSLSSRAAMERSSEILKLGQPAGSGGKPDVASSGGNPAQPPQPEPVVPRLPPQPQSVVPVIPPRRARFRVTLEGSRVNRETRDDPYERDGKRDEVFVFAQAYEYGAGGGLRSNSGLLRTPVMGDPTGRPERIRAGSTLPNPGILGVGASEGGGLRSGDQVPPYDPTRVDTEREPLPLILWEGELVNSSPATAEANAALIVLTIWEWDKPLEASELNFPGPSVSMNEVNFFLTRILRRLPYGTSLPLPKPVCPEGGCNHHAPARRQNPYPVNWDTLTVSNVNPWTVRLKRGGIGSTVRIEGLATIGHQRNRPIGMRDMGSHYGFEPLALALPYNVALDISEGLGTAGNRVEVDCRDDDYLQGYYTLFVRVERIP